MPSRVFTRAVSEEAFFTSGYAEGMAGRFSQGILRTTSQRDDDYEFLLLMECRSRRVVAAAKLLVAPGRAYLAYLQTAADAKGHGYGRHLFSRLFAHAARRGVEHLEISQYTPFGEQYLQPLEERLARRHYPNLHVFTSPAF